MVLDVAGRQIVEMLAFEFLEQVFRHLAQGVDQNVETAAMGHADDDFLHPLFAGTLDQFVDRGDETLAAFEGEALLPDIAGVQIALQAFGRIDALVDVAFLVGVEFRRRAGGFEPLLQPAFLRRVADVHELGANGAAIGFAQTLDDFAQAHRLAAEIQGLRIEGHVHVGLGEVVEHRLEFGNRRPFGALQGVEVGPAGAEKAVRRDQLLDEHLLARHRQINRRAALRPQRTDLGAQGEGFDDRCMGYVAPAALARGAGNHLQRIEILAPLFRYRAGVVEIVLVEFFDIGGVAPEQVRVALKLFHHGIHLSRVSRCSAGNSGPEFRPSLTPSRHGLTVWRGAARRCRARVSNCQGMVSSIGGVGGMCLEDMTRIRSSIERNALQQGL